MDLSAVLDAVTAVQAALTITSPIDASIKAVHRYPPNRQSVLPDTPCWMNTWTLARVEENIDFDGNRRFFYSVNAQLFIKDADLNRAADIATSFHQAWLDALVLSPALSTGADGLSWTPRGGDPTLVLLEWGSMPFIGLNEYLDVEFFV